MVKKEILITIFVFVLIFMGGCQYYPNFTGEATNVVHLADVSKNNKTNFTFPTEDVPLIYDDVSDSFQDYSEVETPSEIETPNLLDLEEIEDEIIIQEETPEVEEPKIIEEDKRVKYFKKIMEFPKIDFTSGLKESFTLITFDKIQNTLSQLREKLRIKLPSFRPKPEEGGVLDVEELPFLHVEGKNIVDDSGEEVFLQGINFGNWLLWETCAYGFLDCENWPEYKFREELELRVQDPTDIEMFFELFENNFILDDDFGRAQNDLGYNWIRLGFHNRYVSDTELTLLDDAINWASANGIYVVLNMHAAPGGQSGAYHADSDGEARLWTEPEIYQPEFKSKWEILAQRYVGNPFVAGYELLNEPVAPTGAELRTLYEETIATIRVYDPDHIILLDGNDYAVTFDGVFETPLSDDNVIYVFHTYEDNYNTFLNKLNEYTNFRNTYQVPIMCNEYGGPNQIMYTSLFENEGIPYAPWSFKFATMGQSNIAYTPPENNLWVLWLDDILINMNSIQSQINQEAINIIQTSLVSDNCKNVLIEYININGRLPPSTQYRFYAGSNQPCENDIELGLLQIPNNIQAMVDSYKLDFIAADIETKVDDFTLTSLMESLQTQYFNPPLDLCSECGSVSSCIRDDCYNFPGGCYFLDPDSCISCNGVDCFSYNSDEQTCVDDPCGLDNCEWNIETSECQVIILPPDCISGETQNCLLQSGVCLGSIETCINNVWPGCTSTNYGSNYQSIESTCDDTLDNDCDSLIDMGDDDCITSPGPGGSGGGGGSGNLITQNEPEPTSSNLGSSGGEGDEFYQEESPLNLYTIDFVEEILETTISEGSGYLINIDGNEYVLVVNSVNENSVSLEINSESLVINLDGVGVYNLLNNEKLHITLLSVNGNEANVKLNVEESITLTQEVPKRTTMGALISGNRIIIYSIIIFIIIIVLILNYFLKIKDLKKGYGKEQVKKTIETAIKSGYSKEQIKKRFIKEGWEEKEMDKLLKKFF